MYSEKNKKQFNSYTQTPSLGGVLLLVWLIILLNNCAQIAQPPGGKKDTLAPVLIDSYPKMKARNTKPKQVELFFNEYITVDNLAQKTIITPGSGITFDIKAKPTSVALIFNEPLKDSTTYTISFTDGVKDASERNPATNLKLVFSTGNQLDSLSVSGVVSNMISGTIIEGALVGLYAPRDTLDAQKVKPIYYTKTDTLGRFLIENIKSGSYDVMSFTDRNNNFLFNPSTESIGFSGERLALNKNYDQLKISLFEQNTTPVRILKTDSRSDSYVLNLNKGLEKYSINFRNNEDSIANTQPNPNQIKFFRSKTTPDTININVKATDSLGTSYTLKHTINFRQKSKRERPEEFLLKVEPTNNEPVEPDFTLKLSFNKPVGALRKEKIKFSIDSLTTTDLANYETKQDLSKSNLETKIKTKAKKFIRIRLDKESANSLFGDTLSKTILTYPILDQEEFGVLRGNVVTKSASYLIELLNDRREVVRQQRNVPAYEFKNVKPGKYRLRLIMDTNNNGQWDTGRYETRIPAEVIRYFPDVLTIKQNFELDDVNL